MQPETRRSDYTMQKTAKKAKKRRTGRSPFRKKQPVWATAKSPSSGITEAEGYVSATVTATNSTVRTAADSSFPERNRRM